MTSVLKITNPDLVLESVPPPGESGESDEYPLDKEHQVIIRTAPPVLPMYPGHESDVVRSKVKSTKPGENPA